MKATLMLCEDIRNLLLNEWPKEDDANGATAELQKTKSYLMHINSFVDNMLADPQDYADEQMMGVVDSVNSSLRDCVQQLEMAIKPDLSKGPSHTFRNGA